MKKALVALLSICMIVCLAACGNNTLNENDASQGSSVASTEQQNTKDNESSNKDSYELSGTYKVPTKNIYVSTPNYQEIEEGYTEVFIVHNSRYVAITAARKDTAASVEEAHATAFDKFKQNIQSYSYVNSIAIKEQSVNSINGIEVYRFEGTMSCGHDTVDDLYAVGYSFIMDDVPCEIIGSVIDKSQSQELKDEIEAVVDAMAKSVRTAE